MAIGTVVPGAAASATITGTAPNFILNLVLPQAGVTQSTSFTLNPTDASVYNTQVVTFTATAQSTESPIVYKWQRSADGLAWTDIVGAGSSSYSVNASLAMNGTKYRCVATTPTVGPVYSLIATLSVRATPEPDGAEWVTAINGQAPFIAVPYAGLLVGNRMNWQSQTTDKWQTWTAGTPSPANIMYSLAAGPAAVVGATTVNIGSSNYLNIYSTADGKNWTLRQNSAAPFGNVSSLAASRPMVAYGAGKFIALFKSLSNSIRVTTSVDGVTWTAPVDATATEPTTLTNIRAVHFANGIFVAVGAGGATWASPTPTDEYLTSTDGVIWTVRKMPATQTWSAVSYNNSTFLVAGTGGVIAYGPTGIAFGKFDIPAIADWSSLASSGSKWVAVGRNTTATLLNSPGFPWTVGSIGVSANWSCVGFSGGRFYALSETGHVGISDGLTPSP
jgi:hypothetical protein